MRLTLTFLSLVLVAFAAPLQPQVSADDLDSEITSQMRD
jgi:hypothetical protein